MKKLIPLLSLLFVPDHASAQAVLYSEVDRHWSPGFYDSAYLQESVPICYKGSVIDLCKLIRLEIAKRARDDMEGGAEEGLRLNTCQQQGAQAQVGYTMTVNHLSPGEQGVDVVKKITVGQCPQR